MFNLNLILNDAPQPWQIGFQDSAAPGFSGIVELHNTLLILIILLLYYFYYTYNKYNLSDFNLVLMDNNSLPPLGQFQSNAPSEGPAGPSAAGNLVSQEDLDSLDDLINKVNNVNLKLATRISYINRIIEAVDILVGEYSASPTDLHLNNIQDPFLFNLLRDRLENEIGINIGPNQPMPAVEEQLNQLPSHNAGPGGGSSGNNGSMLFISDYSSGPNQGGNNNTNNNNYSLIDKIIFNLLIIFEYCIEILNSFIDHFINF